MVRCGISPRVVKAQGRHRLFNQSLGKGIVMDKVEEFQKYGKEQMETATATAGEFAKGVQAIMTAYGDYAKKAMENGNSFVEKLSGVKSFEKVVELQTEYAKSSYETFIAESKKISELYVDLAKQSYKPFEGVMAKMGQMPGTTQH